MINSNGGTKSENTINNTEKPKDSITEKSKNGELKEPKAEKAKKPRKRSNKIPQINLPNGKVIYLSNRELLEEIRLSRIRDQMTDNLARMLQLLCQRFASKGIYRDYSYNEDMQSAAITSLVMTWRNFDETKYDNPFAYFTQCVYHSFLQILNKEKRHRIVRDELLVGVGLDPSFKYTEPKGDMFGDEEDYEKIELDANKLKNLETEEVQMGVPPLSPNK